MSNKKFLHDCVVTLLVPVLIAVFGLIVFTACGNKNIIDTTYTFDRAIIQLANGEVVEGKVQSWSDYSDGDQIQVKIDGTTYLVHSSDVALIKDPA